MAEPQDVNALRRRGRRRLVGAIALVLLAAIILPMVFDQEPRPSAPPVSVRIPREEDANFAPKLAPKVAAALPTADSVPAPVSASPEPQKQALKAADKPAAAAAPPDAAKTAPKAEEKSTSAPPPSDPSKPAPKAAAPQPEPARAASGPAAEQFVVPVAALASQAKVKELVGKLKAARLPYYTEPLATAKGTVTRVRVGPYGDRQAAEDAQRQLKRLGLNPGNVLPKS